MPSATFWIYFNVLLLLAFLLWQNRPAPDPQALARQSVEAKNALLAGDSAAAVRIYRGLVKALPGDARMRLNLAAALEAQGSYAQELAELRNITRNHQELTPAWLMMGMALLRLGKPAEAISPLRNFLSREPNNAVAQFELADAYFASGGYAEAAQRFQALSQADGGSPKVLQGLALSSAALAKSLADKPERESEMVQARATAEEALGKLGRLPESSSLHETMASIEAERGRRNEAVEEWRKAVALAPDDVRLKARLASALVEARSYEEAAGILTPLVRTFPEMSAWQFTLGDALLRERQTEEAIPHLEAAARLNPEFLPARASLGRAYLETGKPLAAIPHLKAAISTDEAAILFQLAQAYKATGQADLAAKALDQQRAAAARQAAAR